jgi:hypothetical protein
LEKETDFADQRVRGEHPHPHRLVVGSVDEDADAPALDE